MRTSIQAENKEGHITPREVEVLALLAQGKPTKEIAYWLNISAETVSKHLKNIYLKTGTHNKIEALNKTKWLIASFAESDQN